MTLQGLVLQDQKETREQQETGEDKETRVNQGFIFKKMKSFKKLSKI